MEFLLYDGCSHLNDLNLTYLVLLKQETEYILVETMVLLLRKKEREDKIYIMRYHTWRLTLMKSHDTLQS